MESQLTMHIFLWMSPYAQEGYSPPSSASPFLHLCLPCSQHYTEFVIISHQEYEHVLVTNKNSTANFTSFKNKKKGFCQN